MELMKEIKENQNLVLELERGNYKQGTINLNQEISKKFKPIAYITLSKPARSVVEDLQKEGVDTQNYYFIDCVSKKASLKDKAEKTTFVDGPTSLTELAIAVTKLVKEKNIGLLVFDSISSLLVYNDELKTVKFLHYLMISVKGTKSKAVYLIMRSDLARTVVKEIELFADNITWLE